MADITVVRVIFAGLLGLVPNHESTPTAFSALLVDGGSRPYASDGCPLPEHHAILSVRAGDCKSNGSPCKRSAKIDSWEKDVNGTWDLRGNLLDIRVTNGSTALPGLTMMRESPTKTLPSSPAEASSLAWVPRALVGHDVNPECLADAVFGCPLSARVDLAGGSVQTCALIELKPDMAMHARRLCPDSSFSEAQIHAFDLRPLGMSSVPSGPPQAMTHTVMALFPDLNRADAKVEISLRSLKGAVLESIVLTAGDRETIDIWVVNIPDPNIVPIKGDFCTITAHLIDRHFEQLYNLSERRPENAPLAMAARPVPHATNCTSPVKPAMACPAIPFVDPEAVEDDEDGDVDFIPPDKGACATLYFNANPAAGKIN